ncbi:hypothetical protein AB4143_16890 [Vibrio breoganii]
MKRWFTIIAALLLSISLSGCGEPANVCDGGGGDVLVPMPKGGCGDMAYPKGDQCLVLC